MSEKRTKIIFIVLFAILLAVPLLTTNMKEGTISEAEKRLLKQKPVLHQEDGTWNENFTADFEAWFNDNVGLRSQMVIANARIQYYGFNLLANNSDMYLGPNGELNYATAPMLVDYQHLNLRTEAQLDKIAQSYQTVSDFMESQGVQLYYFQCWDKHSIYPEYFPDTVLQLGDVSQTDQVIHAMETKTTLNVVSPKQVLIDSKGQYETYSIWGDPSHWTQRGAFIGYTEVMRAIDANNPGKYRILTEADYDITVADEGETVFGGIHRANYSEIFTIKDPNAYLSDESPIYLSKWAGNCRNIYYNDNAGNQETLLIFGDSYIDSFLYDDFAESFYRVVMVRDYLKNMIEIVDYYKPSIVIIENAERCDRNAPIINVAADILAQ